MHKSNVCLPVCVCVCVCVFGVFWRKIIQKRNEEKKPKHKADTQLYGRNYQNALKTKQSEMK